MGAQGVWELRDMEWDLRSARIHVIQRMGARRVGVPGGPGRAGERADRQHTPCSGAEGAVFSRRAHRVLAERAR